jgi:hypothetical protein
MRIVVMGADGLGGYVGVRCAAVGNDGTHCPWRASRGDPGEWIDCRKRARQLAFA